MQTQSRITGNSHGRTFFWVDMHGVPTTTLTNTFANIDHTNNNNNSGENNTQSVCDRETEALTELWQLLGLHHTTVEHMEAVLQARKNAEQTELNTQVNNNKQDNNNKSKNEFWQRQQTPQDEVFDEVDMDAPDTA